MKNSILTIFAAFILTSCVIKNPTPNNCVTQTRTIKEINTGTSNNIVFTDYGGDHYYINRGLERGLNLDSLNAKVLNKTVTLHLAKLFGGAAISEHIAQLKVKDEVIFTEFN